MHHEVIKMKVILLENIKGLGREGDVVDAKDGYANNFLLPKQLAVRATEENMAILEEKAEERRIQKEKEKQDAQAVFEQIHGKSFELKVKTGSGDRLFGSVTAKEIAEEIGKQCNIEIDKRKIELSENIKEKGEKEISIKLHPDITATVKIIISAL